MVSQNFIYST